MFFGVLTAICPTEKSPTAKNPRAVEHHCICIYYQWNYRDLSITVNIAMIIFQWNYKDISITVNIDIIIFQWNYRDISITVSIAIIISGIEDFGDKRTDVSIVGLRRC